MKAGNEEQNPSKVLLSFDFKPPSTFKILLFALAEGGDSRICEGMGSTIKENAWHNYKLQLKEWGGLTRESLPGRVKKCADAVLDRKLEELRVGEST